MIAGRDVSTGLDCLASLESLHVVQVNGPDAYMIVLCMIVVATLCAISYCCTS